MRRARRRPSTCVSLSLSLCWQGSSPDRPVRSRPAASANEETHPSLSERVSSPLLSCVPPPVAPFVRQSFLTCIYLFIFFPSPLPPPLPGVLHRQADAKRIYREMYILRHMRHDEIIHLRDVLMPSAVGDVRDLYLVRTISRLPCLCFFFFFLVPPFFRFSWCRVHII